MDNRLPDAWSYSCNVKASDSCEKFDDIGARPPDPGAPSRGLQGTQAGSIPRSRNSIGDLRARDRKVRLTTGDLGLAKDWLPKVRPIGEVRRRPPHFGRDGRVRPR